MKEHRKWLADKLNFIQNKIKNSSRDVVILIIVYLVTLTTIAGTFLTEVNLFTLSSKINYTLEPNDSMFDVNNPIFLEPSPALVRNADGSYNLNGETTLTINHTDVNRLKKYTVTINTNSDSIKIFTPSIDPNDLNDLWDLEYDLKSTTTPFTGSTFNFNGCNYFDGTTQLSLPRSVDQFEDGKMAISVDWTPRDKFNDRQEIIGHFNWELWQNKNSVTLSVGRMNNKDGPFHHIEYKITERGFFGTPHNAIILYSPADTPEEDGFISLYIDGQLANTLNIGQDKIFKDYGGNIHNLTLGKAGHAGTSYFTGCVDNVKYLNSLPELHQSGVATFSSNLSSQNRIILEGSNIPLPEISISIKEKNE